MQRAQNICFQNDCISKEKEGSQNYLMAISNNEQICQDIKKEKDAHNESSTKYVDMSQPVAACNQQQFMPSYNQQYAAPKGSMGVTGCRPNEYVPTYGRANSNKPCNMSYVPNYGNAQFSKCGSSYAPVYGRANNYASNPSCNQVQESNVGQQGSCNEQQGCNQQQMSYQETDGSNQCTNKEPCCRTSNNLWLNRKLVDQDGSCVVVPNKLTYEEMRRKYWCCTPLTEYMATTGELGRQILTGETVIKRRIDRAPPCNITEDIMIPCRGYLRDECFLDRPPCVDGKLDTRPVVQRYWKPCTNKLAREVDSSRYAGTGVALAHKVRKCTYDNFCY